MRRGEIAGDSDGVRWRRWRDGDGIEVSLCAGVDAAVRHPSFLRHEKALEIN